MGCPSSRIIVGAIEPEAVRPTAPYPQYRALPAVPRLVVVPGSSIAGPPRQHNVTRSAGCGFAPGRPQSSPDRIRYETYFSARVWYSNMSPSANQTSISRLASAGLADACTRLATGSPLALAYALLWCAKSPRIVPGAAWSG